MTVRSIFDGISGGRVLNEDKYGVAIRCSDGTGVFIPHSGYSTRSLAAFLLFASITPVYGFCIYFWFYG